MRLINIYGSTIWFEAYLKDDTKYYAILSNAKGKIEYSIEHGKDWEQGVGQDYAQIVVRDKQGGKKLFSGTVANTSAAYISTTGVGGLSVEVSQLLALAVAPRPPVHAPSGAPAPSGGTGTGVNTAPGPRGTTVSNKTLPPDYSQAVDAAWVLNHTVQKVDSTLRLLALESGRRSARDPLPVFDPSGDDLALGNVLLTTFTYEFPPEAKPPTPDQAALEVLDGVEAAKPATEILSSAEWFESSSADLVKPILLAEAKPDAERAKLADIVGGARDTFETELGSRTATNSDFSNAVQELQDDRPKRLNALPEYVTGSFLRLTFARVAALTAATANTPVETWRLDRMVNDAEAARDALGDSRKDYLAAVEGYLTTSHLKGTPLEATVRRGLAAKYLADPSADVGFFDDKIQTLGSVIDALTAQRAGPPAARLHWARR